MKLPESLPSISLRKLIELRTLGLIPDPWVMSYKNRTRINPIEEAHAVLHIQEREQRVRLSIGIGGIAVAMFCTWLYTLLPDRALDYSLEVYMLPYFIILVITAACIWMVPATNAPVADEFCRTIAFAVQLAELDTPIEESLKHIDVLVHRARAGLESARTSPQYGESGEQLAYAALNLLGLAY